MKPQNDKYDFSYLVINEFDENKYNKTLALYIAFTAVALITGLALLHFLLIYKRSVLLLPVIILLVFSLFSLFPFFDLIKYTRALKIKSGWTLEELISLTGKTPKATKTIITHVLNAGFGAVSAQPQTEDEETSGLYPVPALIKKYLEQLDIAGKAIDDLPMKEKLEDLMLVTRSIHKALTDNPQKAAAARKIITYYLPEIVAQTERYKNLDDNELESPTIKKIKLQIIKAVEVTTQAFYTLYDNIYKEDIIKFESELETLKNIYIIDGLLNLE